MQHAARDPIAETFPALEWTGERYLPWIRNATMSYEHFHRYAFAAQFAANKRVLDLGTGEGYGANVLAGNASYVLGIDIDPACIQHASSKYNRKNLDFEIGAFAKVPHQPDHSFDLIVCFEAIEHTGEQDALLAEAKRLLKPDGLFIASTPDKSVYRKESPEGNPYHIRELEMAEFHQLLMNFFQETSLLGQRILPVSSIWPLDASVENIVEELTAHQGDQEFEYPSNEKRTPIYVIGLASDSRETLGAAGSVLIDSSLELMRETDHTIREWVRTTDETREIVNYLRRENEWHKDELNRTVERLNADIRYLQGCVEDVTSELNTIYSSKSWTAIQKFCAMRDRAFPVGSLRRRMLQGMIGSSSRR